MKVKEIRFVDTSYKTLFTVKHNGKIKIILPDCRIEKFKIEIIDEYHFYLVNENGFKQYCYHICEFAEKMREAGNRYEKC